jgi:hypothetical protein
MGTFEGVAEQRVPRNQGNLSKCDNPTRILAWPCRPQLGMKWGVARGMLLGPEGLLRPVDSGVIEPAHEYGLDAVKDN